MINTLRTFWNGIKINGEKNLIKLSVGSAGEGLGIDYLFINIEWDWSTNLIMALKEILEYRYVVSQNLYIAKHEYFKITKENPLFDHFMYIFVSKKLHDNKIRKIKDTALEAELATLKNVADETTINKAKTFINEINAEKQRAEEAAKAEEDASRQAIFDAERAEKNYITECITKYPIGTDKFFVKVCWSEHPAFYDWEDNELKMSLKAFDLVIHKLDKEVDDGYYKTKFEIVRTEDNESVYRGRYDLGDMDGGLIKHMKGFADYCYKADHDEETFVERIAFINDLESIIANSKEYTVATVAIDAKFHEFVMRYKKNNEEGQGD